MYKIASDNRCAETCVKVKVSGVGSKLTWMFPFCYHEWGTVLDLPVVQLAHIFFETGTGEVFSA